MTFFGWDSASPNLPTVLRASSKGEGKRTHRQYPRAGSASFVLQEPAIDIRRRDGCNGRMAMRHAKDSPPDLPPGVKLLRTLEGHQNSVTSVAFDPQGQTLASGSYDRTAKLWDPQSGKLLRTLEGHQKSVFSVAFDPQGRTLASGSDDKTVKLWDPQSGKLLRTLEGHLGWVISVAFDPQGRTLASGSYDITVKLWDPQSRKLLRTLEGHQDWVNNVAFDPQGRALASGSDDTTVKLWEPQSGKLLRTLEGHQKSVLSVAFDPQGRTLASGGFDGTVKLWEPQSGKLLRTLEGHTSFVDVVAFSRDGALLASKSHDGTVRLWRCDTWEPVAVIPVPAHPARWLPALAFHPTEPLLATGGSAPGTSEDESGKLIHLWELDLAVLLGKAPGAAALPPAVHHTTARIVVVGDSGVGKTGLGWRLAHGEFKEHASTHGQQFWVVGELGKRRTDGTECEAVLWDLAGQPDYRLIHALFLDDADLALVLFDPTDTRDPLRGVEFWLKQLNVVAAVCDRRSVSGDDQRRSQSAATVPTILVAARSDRGSPTLAHEELESFCRARGIAGYVRTSAKAGEGLDELFARMKTLIPWEDKPATVTTATFKRIKDYVLGLKESKASEAAGQPAIVSAEELRARLERSDPDWQFTDAEMQTAVGHLETYGYVKRLRTSKGERRILLAPELLNNLAASFVLEARRNARGLGALEEKRLLGAAGDRYDFPELRGLSAPEQTILLDAAALLFIEHHVCFRETDPLSGQSFLVFPELINMKRPVEEEKAPEDGVAYTASGAVENVFASLAVLLGYTSTFARISQWQNNARYEVGDGSVCGFRQEAERDGELDFVLCFSPAAPGPLRTLLQGLFESFLARRNLKVMRYEPVVCSKGHALNRTVLREKLAAGNAFTFCNDCGEKLALAKAAPIQLTREEQAAVETQRRSADARTRFEQAVFRVQAYVTEQKIKPPECFISYAWGEREHERWVEKSLATDLQKAGVGVVLDRWENSRIGANVMRFMERIEECDKIIVVGTPAYRAKYANKGQERGYVLASEGEMVALRKLGPPAQRESILPVLLAGDERASFPLWLQGHVYADFREAEAYFITAFRLILSLYGLSPHHSAVADLVESLEPGGPMELRPSRG
jgi:WD40 repeat protein/GTPase SAR1 family protein